jgi:hypothetical protein
MAAKHTHIVMTSDRANDYEKLAKAYSVLPATFNTKAFDTMVTLLLNQREQNNG